MADGKEENSNRSKAQGTNHHTTSSSRATLSHNGSMSESHPNMPPSSSRPATTSPPPPKTRTTNHESQTITTNTSSLAPSGHVISAMDTNGPSPYGTRSRNRAGNSRPNYAEDHELEEYEWNATKKPQASLGSAVSAQLQIGDSERSSGINTRRSSTTASGTASGKVAIPTTPKEQIPGMSSFSITPEASVPAQPAPKKRKAPSGGQANSNGTTGVGHAKAPNHSRKNPNVPAVAVGYRETNMMSFENSQGYLQNGQLIADDGTALSVDDHVYLICEPPGEPYYLARIMEFLHPNNDPNLPIDSVRVNWYYRPRDINRKATDTRLVFASMHSDPCPLTSLRGRCQIFHRSGIDDLEEYRKKKDNFWYDKVFDRFIHRYYEVIPTNQVINVPARVKKVLDERWKYLIVEIGRGKELTSAIKTCKRCVGYCASNDSVDCAMCKNTYHMNCVQPPLLKKPARGFGWSCGPCSRKQERKLEARNTPLVGDRPNEAEEEEWLEEEDDHGQGLNAGNQNSNPGSEYHSGGAKPATADQIAQAKMWPYRYFGIHCRVEDALDFDDRIYPRAGSRLGPKHQATVHVWHGKPVQFVKPAESRRKYLKGGSHKKDAKLVKDTVADLEADKSTKEKRPKWVMDQPPGYIARGEDHPNGDSANTAKLQFRMPRTGETFSRGEDDQVVSIVRPAEREKLIDDYIAEAKKLAGSLGVAEFSTNFLDKALELLCTHKYASQPALAELATLNRRRDLKELEFSREEIKKFEEGVAKHGSEHRKTSKHVGKSQKLGEIVRFYYMWKKSPNGRRIWGSHESRKGKKAAKQTDSKLVDDVADDVDDSAFDNAKAATRKRGFECKFCATRKSPQWRRAPYVSAGATVPFDPASKSKDKSAHLMVALCQRCASLWRKYGIQWEPIDDVAKKISAKGGKHNKRTVDDELLMELVSANEICNIGMSTTTVAAAASVGIEVPSGLTLQPGQEGSRKRQKIAQETHMVPEPVYTEPPKKKVVEKPPEPPIIPERPRMRDLPCAVCNEMEPTDDQRLCCRHCRLTVHRNCYGIPEGRSSNKWTCDMCANDSSCQISTSYDCFLCPIRSVEQELMDPPKVSHKKKTDREREKERLEREMVVNETNTYLREQQAKGRPLHPREPLKRTSGNNWVHVLCAIFSAEIRFGDARLLEPVEGISSLPQSRYSHQCKLCKSTEGICVACKQCSTTFHVTCAQRHGHVLGLDVSPVKGSRRDAMNVITLGTETGNATPVLYCKEHTTKTLVHPINEAIEGSPLNALQLYSQNNKQADTSLTGTVRKAASIGASTKLNIQAHTNTGHRSSLSSGMGATAHNNRSSRVSPAAMTVMSEEVDEDGDRVVYLNEVQAPEQPSKECAVCGTDASPLWHKIQPKVLESAPSVNGVIPVPQEQHQADALPVNGNANSNGSHIHDDMDNHVSSGADLTNGFNSHMTEPNGNAIPSGDYQNAQSDGGMREVVDDLTESSHDRQVNGDSIEESSRDGITVQDGQTKDQVTGADVFMEPSLGFRCHKCHLKKLREPTPPPAPTPPPEAATLELQTAPESGTPSPLQQHAWPSAPAIPSHDQYRAYPPPPAPLYGPPPLPNGVPHSPPVAPPQLQSHFVGPHAPYRAPHYAHPHQQQQEMPIQAQVNGNPPIYHLQRASGGRPANLHYVPPPPPVPRSPPPRRPIFMQGPQERHGTRQNPSPPPAPRSPLRRRPIFMMGPQERLAALGPPRNPSPPAPVPRSPPRRRSVFVQQGPHGPPRPEENPFASPHPAQTSPRESYHGIYGSPRGNYERPDTPPDGIGRNGSWAGNEGPLTNGASASPSLRNLLH